MMLQSIDIENSLVVEDFLVHPSKDTILKVF
jgi:hypothetical protein